MMRWSSTSWPKELLLLRWIFTVLSLGCALFTACYTAQKLMKLHDGDVLPGLDLFYFIAHVFLISSACVAAWLKRLKGFVLFGIASQTIHALGMFCMLEVFVTSPERFLRDHVGSLLLDLAILGFGVFMAIYLAMRYVTVRTPKQPAEMHLDSPSWSKELLLLRWIFTALSLWCAVATARSLALYDYDFEMLAPVWNVVILLLISIACVCGWLKRARGFMLLGVASATVQAFWSSYNAMDTVCWPSFTFREHGRVLARDMVPLTVALLLIVYLTTRHIVVKAPAPATRSLAR